jgi:hypothetical protein
MLDKAQITAIQKDISNALKVISEKYNLSMSGTRVSYSDVSFKLACTFADKTETNGINTDPVLLRNLVRNGIMYGLNLKMLHKEIDTPQGRGIFQGLRGSKAVIKILANQKQYAFPAAWVATQLAA